MHTRSHTRSALAVLLAVTLLLSGCVTLTGYKAKGQQSLSAAHVPNSMIDVTTENGSVQITADETSSEVLIVATITAAGDTQEQADERLAGVQVSVQRLADGTLKIAPTFPGGRRSNDSCSLDITLPQANGAVVKSSNGAVTLIGLTGDADVHTSNGSILVKGQSGAVRARTSNGRVHIADAGGSVDAQTSNGSVEIAGLTHSAVVKTSNGRVICRAADGATGPIQIKTSNGSVTLVVPPSIGGTIVASTSNGSVNVSGSASRIEGSKQHRTIRLADQGSESQIETSNGGITVTIAEPDSASADR